MQGITYMYHRNIHVYKKKQTETPQNKTLPVNHRLQSPRFPIRKRKKVAIQIGRNKAIRLKKTPPDSLL
jgi:hypothetical protein